MWRQARLDGFWEKPLEAWDMAAGIILIREAGGFVADTSGGTDMFGTRSIAAGNEYMLKSVLELVQRPVPAA
jgi:myo-inositol-1(or 4)-monophosphatase